jgi:hypothetical protein
MKATALSFVIALAPAAVTPPVSAEVRPGRFTSAALGREVAYVVDLPPSYEAAAPRKYPVVYALHGLFEGSGFWERRGLAASLSELRARGGLPEFLVVAVDGGNSFFVNAKAGRYEDLVTRDLVAHVEASFRVVPGRAGRGLLGISMGGYAALHIAFDQPALVAAVATHSAMLLETMPSAEQGARRGQMAAFHQVFGDPIDAALWAANDPPEGRAGAPARLRRRGPLRPRGRPPRAAPDPRAARRRPRLRAAARRPRLRVRPHADREEPALPRRAAALASQRSAAGRPARSGARRRASSAGRPAGGLAREAVGGLVEAV